MNNQIFFTSLGLASISLALHGSLFFILDRVASNANIQVTKQQKKIIKETGGRLEFQFIEAPPKTQPLRPSRTKKISSHNALNQDTLKDKSKAAILPHTALRGRSDQLAQRQGNLSQAPSPRVEPSRGAQKEIEQENKKAEDKSSDMTSGEKTFLINKKMSTQGEKNKASDNHEPRAAQNPKPEVHGNGGTDKITTQEIGRIKSPGAMLFGQTSFEATGSGMGEYMKRLKEKIWLAWFPYIAFQYPQDFRGADVVVSFMLDPKGDVKIVRVLDSAGSPLFASYCVEAVQKASGFGALPKEILELTGKDGLEIKFGFHYR